MKTLLRPFSLTYGLLTDFRNKLYDTEKIKSGKFAVPIVSVGNVTMGGTGKTPILCELIRWAQSAGFRPAVVSRGYKGTFSDVQKVDTNCLDAEYYGDEPVLIARSFLEVPVYVGRNRCRGVAQLLQNENVDIIFADDAFQHRQLHRDIDVVVIDVTEPIENYRLIPEGRAREDAHRALKRATFVVLNKCNLVGPEQKQAVIEWLETHLNAQNKEIIESEYYIKNLVRIDKTETIDLGKFEKVLLVSGIGNPMAFEKLIAKSLDVQGHLIYPDHHFYSLKDVQDILKTASEKNVNRIVVTEKDAVKLSAYKEAGSMFAATLSVQMSLRIKALYEQIVQLCR